MKNYLKSFELHRNEKITFDSFDMDFYESFVNYLIYDFPHFRREQILYGLKLNTIVRTIKHLKSFLRDRMHKKIIAFFDLTSYNATEEELSKFRQFQNLFAAKKYFFVTTFDDEQKN